MYENLEFDLDLKLLPIATGAYGYGLLLNTVQWLFDFKQFDWFGGHRLSAYILVIDYIWKTPGN